MKRFLATLVIVCSLFSTVNIPVTAYGQSPWVTMKPKEGFKLKPLRLNNMNYYLLRDVYDGTLNTPHTPLTWNADTACATVITAVGMKVEIYPNTKKVLVYGMEKPNMANAVVSVEGRLYISIAVVDLLSSEDIMEFSEVDGALIVNVPVTNDDKLTTLKQLYPTITDWNSIDNLVWRMWNSKDDAEEQGDLRGQQMSDAFLKEVAQKSFDLHNDGRVKAGLPALAWDNSMVDLANTRAKELATKYSHDRPDGTRVPETFYYAENISISDYGIVKTSYNSPYELSYDNYDQISHSEAHWRQWVDSRFTKGAIGVYYAPTDGNLGGSVYVVQLFSAKK